MEQKYLQEILDYDPETGVFRWKVSRYKAVPGRVAGTTRRDGYRHIMIDAVAYLSHRLAWLYVYGEWPKDQIDHINRVQQDNRISNLRESTNQQNSFNQKIRSDNTTGYKSVFINKPTGRYYTRVHINGKCKQIGTFDTPEEAALALEQATKELHGDFYYKK